MLRLPFRRVLSPRRLRVGCLSRWHVVFKHLGKWSDTTGQQDNQHTYKRSTTGYTRTATELAIPALQCSTMAHNGAGCCVLPHLQYCSTTKSNSGCSSMWLTSDKHAGSCRLQLCSGQRQCALKVAVVVAMDQAAVQERLRGLTSRA